MKEVGDLAGSVAAGVFVEDDSGARTEFGAEVGAGADWDDDGGSVDAAAGLRIGDGFAGVEVGAEWSEDGGGAAIDAGVEDVVSAGVSTEWGEGSVEVSAEAGVLGATAEVTVEADESGIEVILGLEFDPEPTEKLMDDAAKFIDDTGKGLEKGWEDAGQAVEGWVEGAGNALEEGWEDASEAVEEWVEDAGDAVEEIAEDVADFFAGFFTEE